MMGGDMFKGVAAAFFVLLVLSPLAVWKLCEVVWWLVTHVRVTW